MKRLVIGILAHVDSGKTTLSEGMLYCTGEIRKLGRVDHKDAFLDTHHIEQDRGITIFSKQALMHFGNTELTVLDTPGHVDFSAEAERTLQVLDYAILVISGSEGIQAHTETLWSLLKRYNIPVFIFINKMDLAERKHSEIMNELKEKFDYSCIDFSDTNSEGFLEDAAMCSDELMNSFSVSGKVNENEIADAIFHRNIFPCYFGSALKLDGVKEFIGGLEQYTQELYDTNKDFGAKIFKIGEDDKGARLTYLKITGKGLKIKASIEYGNGKAPEKVNQIRIYSGAKFKAVEEAVPGTVCAVTGLTHTYPGMGLGFEKNSESLIIEPVLSYRVDLPNTIDIHTALGFFRRLEDEEPQFHVIWNENLKEINIRIMGEIQLEVLKQLVSERFKINVEFSEGSILYKETIASPVEGVGHYEPLRHYAEVHLLLEPGKRGSGIHFATACSEDKLDRNWQRLILTHLYEKPHIGVLTGSPITDMKITLIAGRAHQKHTEGGDFRQATYRAIRQGLMSAESILLEPWYNFKLEVPSENVGRAMTDINNMGGEFSQPEISGDFSVISGSAPVLQLRNYHTQVMTYTAGKGRLSCILKGYESCRNTPEVIEQTGYNAETDIENTADSVFCSHGAGFIVKWDKVREYMHVESGVQTEEKEDRRIHEARVRKYIADIADNDELMRIFEQTYGPVKRNLYNQAIVTRAVSKESDKPKSHIKIQRPPEGAEYLLIDGYNVIFSWDELKKLAAENLDLARNRLINILCDYQGITQCELILVFDAYKVKNNPGAVEKIYNINVVYTKEAETADMYIERVTHELKKKRRVRVVTSDGMEQLIILANGAMRSSSESFYKEVEMIKEEIRSFL